jgi:hypothetical protein
MGLAIQVKQMGWTPEYGPRSAVTKQEPKPTIPRRRKWTWTRGTGNKYHANLNGYSACPHRYKLNPILTRNSSPKRCQRCQDTIRNANKHKPKSFITIHESTPMASPWGIILIEAEWSKTPWL